MPHFERPTPVLLMSRGLTPGGTERQMTEVARSLDRSRFLPHVACFSAGGFRAEELRESGVPLLDLQLRSLIRPDVLRAARVLKRYIQEFSIPLVHTFDYPANIFGIPAAKFARAPVVLGSQRAYRSMYDLKTRCLLRATDHLADGVVVNCEAMRQHLVHDYSVPAQKIHLCYNGIDPSIFFPAPRQRPALLADATAVIGLVCVLRPEKNIPCLIEAFAAAYATRPGARLLIVGSGPELPRLEALAAKLGIREACRFEPAVKDVAGWLHAIDVFVLPSLYEALSNSLMEAMACGCCAIASRVGGNPELIEHGETGLLFESDNVRHLADHLGLLIDRPDFRVRLARKGAARIADNFSIRASLSRMQQIYDSFLHGDTACACPA